MHEEKRLRVLLVDDEKIFLDVLAKRMGRRNMYVTAACGSAEGIQALRNQDFDVAVTDLKMEKIDGIELMKIFRKMCPDMSVIILTGHGSEDAVEEGMAQGAFDYLSKPCDLDELVQKIIQAAGR